MRRGFDAKLGTLERLRKANLGEISPIHNYSKFQRSLEAPLNTSRIGLKKKTHSGSMGDLTMKAIG